MGCDQPTAVTDEDGDVMFSQSDQQSLMTSAVTVSDRKFGVGRSYHGSSVTMVYGVLLSSIDGIG